MPRRSPPVPQPDEIVHAEGYVRNPCSGLHYTNTRLAREAEERQSKRSLSDAKTKTHLACKVRKMQMITPATDSEG